MIRVADYIIKFLVEKGSDQLFLLPGGAAMFLNDAITLNPNMKYTAVHHEQTTTMAAECYARATGKVGIAMVTAGPGATNAITGVAGAWVDSVPMIVLAGQSKTIQTIQSRNLKNFRQMGAQEINSLAIVESITKYSAMITEASSIRYHMEKAYHMATEGRPGPVWLDIPIDIQNTMIDEHNLQGYIQEVHKDDEDINKMISKVVDLFQNAKRPVVIAGGGIKSSKSEVIFEELIKKLDVPVVTTRLGCDLLAHEDEHFAGRVGIRGDRAGNFTVQNADLILSLGTRLSIPVTGYDYDAFAREAKIIMVDIDDAELNKETIKIDIPIKCELNQFICLLNSAIKHNTYEYKEWLRVTNSWKYKYVTCEAKYWQQDEYVNSYCLVDMISQKAKEDTIVLADAGSAVDVVYHAFKVKKGQRVLLSGGLASMGHSLPGSIGASIGHDGNTICITGDGSLQLNIQELSTIIYNQLNVKLFVLNNNGYLTIRGAQNNHFKGRLIGESSKSGLGFPNFEKLADAYGITYRQISQNKVLEQEIEEILSINGPVFCEVIMEENQLIAPKQSSMAMPDGKMVSKPLEDMYPFLDREEFMSNMFVRIYN